MKELIQKRIDQLADLCLETNGVYHKYSDKDLMNATLILMEVFMAKMHDKHKSQLTIEQMEKLAEEAGASFHQTILLYTGVDMKKVL